uniref:Uncharacterized protein n=1 Tax=Arundo donax TaxID=35708 RepID=A0A0A8Y9K7_ARUDO
MALAGDGDGGDTWRLRPCSVRPFPAGIEGDSIPTSSHGD